GPAGEEFRVGPDGRERLVDLAHALVAEGTHRASRLARELAHRRDDVHIGAAAAEISAHALADIVVAKLRALAPRLVEERHAGEDLPRRAVAALEGIVLEKGLLHGMGSVARQALDGRDARALERGG